MLKCHSSLFDSEENVYLLCKKLREDGIAKSDGSDLFVVFISNEKKQASYFGSILISVSEF